MKSNVTFNCSLLRYFSLLKFFQVLYEKHLHYLALCESSSENISLIKIALLSKGTLVLFAHSEPREQTTREIAASLA